MERAAEFVFLGEEYDALRLLTEAHFEQVSMKPSLKTLCKHTEKGSEKLFGGDIAFYIYVLYLLIARFFL